MKKVTKEMLVNAANELNEEFGLEPAIKVGKGATEETMKEGILKACSLYDAENDKLTPETLAVMKAVNTVTKASATAPATPVEDEPEDEDEAVAPVELTEDQVNVLAELKDAKKTADLLEILDDEMFDDVREALTAEKNPIKLKSAMRRHISGETGSAAKPKADKAKPKKSSIRVGTKSFQTLADELLASGAEDDEIVECFAELYLERKNETDKVYIGKRAAIYMRIAKDKADAITKALALEAVAKK